MQDDVRRDIAKLLPRLRKFSCALTGSFEKGEDLAQETCLRALDRAHQWRPGTRLDSWLFRIARNLWIDALRAQKPMTGAASIDDLPIPDARSLNNSAEAHHEARAVRAAIAALPAEQRLMVALICIDGRSYQEAAELAGTPIGTVMSRLARARRTLHARIYGEEEPERQARMGEDA